MVVLTPDLEDGGYAVTVPALPGCITEGKTIDEALTNAREAIDCIWKTWMQTVKKELAYH